MKAHVYVTLKTSVLDPQGQTIHNALRKIGYSDVTAVRQGKVFDIELDGGDRDLAYKRLSEACERLLANTIVENYAIEIA